MQVDQPPLELESVDLHAFLGRHQSSSGLDLNQHCQEFLDLIANYLSLSIGGILRRDLDNRLQITTVKDYSNGYSQQEEDSRSISSKSHCYLSNIVSQLVQKYADRFERQGLQHWVCQEWQVYSSRLHWHHDQHVLFLTQHPLSAQDWQWIERQILLMSDYFDLHLAFSQQRAALLAKQQHIHRTTHQLGTPLSLITLYADMLRVKASEGVFQDYLGPLQQAVKQLHHHLQDLVDDDGEDIPTTEYCDLRGLIAENVQAFQPRLQSRKIAIHYPQVSAEVCVDRWQMLQVFDNLLSNALHFSPDGSQIILTWQQFQTEFLIEVRDQGPGLSPEDLCCMFSPYYSRRQGGRGLGLAIAQQIVCRHQGRLWASNLPEGGAQFSISLPQAPKT